MIKQAEPKPQELFNEKQKTIKEFDTKLSVAADDYAKACIELDGWKKVKAKKESALVEEMQRAKRTFVNLADNRQLTITVTPTKVKIRMKELKAKKTKTTKRI